MSLQVSRLAAALHSLGYRPGDAIASDLPNMHHNLLLQLACCHIGASVATAKDIDNLHTLKQKGVPFKGAVAATTDSFLCTQDAELPLAPVAAVSGQAVYSDPSLPPPHEGGGYFRRKFRLKEGGAIFSRRNPGPLALPCAREGV